ncbi:hypothetical protein JQ544_28765 [Bradyrhizobium diazoefficiens]|nr:hypothetical protein [Bradyrhizobium diazoefficiens]
MLLDGTWNDADDGGADTNIVRLRQKIAEHLSSSLLHHRFAPCRSSRRQLRGRIPGRRRFQGADLTGANLCGATVSPGQFQGRQGGVRRGDCQPNAQTAKALNRPRR